MTTLTNNQRPVPYNGEENYIFVSYAHRDSARVYPILLRLQEDGYRLWFDEGITPGSEWDENIAKHAKNCRCCVAFLSEAYLASDNCRDELNFVRDLNKDRLLVYLDELELPDGMRMRLNRLQALPWYKYEIHPTGGIRKLESAEGVRDCRREDAFTKTSESDSASTAGTSSEKGDTAFPSRIKYAIIGAVLLLALGIGVFLGSRGKSSPEAADSAQETVASTEEETQPSKEVKADRQLTVTLTAEDGMSIGEFSDAVERVTERMDILVPDKAYTMEVKGDQVILAFSGDALKGMQTARFLQHYVSRPAALFLAANESRNMASAISLSANDLVSVTSCSSPDEAALTAGMEADQPYLKVVLSDDAAAKAAEINQSGTFAFLQDFDLYKYAASSILCISAQMDADGKTFYVNTNGSDVFHDILIYNWTHEPLAAGFTFEISDDVNKWADWEDPADTGYPGQNQVAFDEISGDSCAIAFSAYEPDEISEGQWLDAQNLWKKRLDLLETPYAFGIYNEKSVTIKLAPEHLGDSVINMISTTYYSPTLFLENMKLSLSATSYTTEPLSDGTYQLKVQVNDYTTESLATLTERLLQSKESLNYWIAINQDFLFAGSTEQTITDGLLTFTTTCYGECDSVSEDDLWLINLMRSVDLNDEKLPVYNEESRWSDPEDAAFGIADMVSEQKINGYLQALQKAFPAVEFYLDADNNQWINCDLNLAVDDSLAEKGPALVKEILLSIEDQPEAPISLRFYLIEEDNDTHERARIIYSKDYRWYTRDLEQTDAKISLHGLFYGGRLQPYAEAFYRVVSTDDFFVELAKGYTDNIADAWDLEE